MSSQFATALLTFHVDVNVDVNVGDPIWPAPGIVEIPRLLGGSISVLGYPLAMVLAEKIVTAIQRGTANTRWRTARTSTCSVAVTRSTGRSCTGRWSRSRRTGERR